MLEQRQNGLYVTRRGMVAALGVGGLALAGMAPLPNWGRAERLLNTLKKDGRFELFLGAIERAKLTDLFAKSKHHTVFAPTDDAVRKLPAAQLTDLTAGKDASFATTFVKQHVVEGEFKLDALKKRTIIDALSGQKLAVASSKDKITLEAECVIAEGVDCANGFLHVIETPIPIYTKDVLQTLKDLECTALVKLVEDCPDAKALITGSNQVTFFEPTNTAIEAAAQEAEAASDAAERRKRVLAFIQSHAHLGRVFRCGIDSKKPLASISGSTLDRLNRSMSLPSSKDAEDGCLNGVVHRIVLPS